MRKHLLLLILFLQFALCYSQQFAQYNTQTLFDTFENPSQKAFKPDTSRKFAFNFFIPNLQVNSSINGPAQKTFKKLIYTGVYDAGGLELGEGRHNKFHLDHNTYIAMFRIFNNIYSGAEMGFSWQVKTDLSGFVTNETLAIINDPQLFSNAEYANTVNNDLNSTSYHQFSFTYRENFNRQLGIGFKVSYLSGIAYSDLDMYDSDLLVNPIAKSYQATLRGRYKSNFIYTEPDETNLLPGIRNPGLSLSLSANYKFPKGWYVLANLKDLGFISWKDKPYTYTFDKTINVITTNNNTGHTNLESELEKELLLEPSRKNFNTLINGKAEFLLNKDTEYYQPNLLISKNLFNSGGNIALVNTARYKTLNASLSTAYNLDNYFMLGGQFMIKSPNAEFFIGSDQLFNSYYTAKGIITSNENIGKSYSAAALYMGFSLKFGNVVERWQNTSNIPVGERNNGFIKRMYKKVFKKKRFEGQR